MTTTDIIISIDDVSPHKLSGVNAINNCLKLIDVFPDIKFILFIPIAYFRPCSGCNLKRIDTRTHGPLELWKYEDFCKTLSDLPNNFMFAYHGYYHGITEGWPKNNNDEFKSLSYNEAKNKIELMLEGVNKSGLSDRFERIFRPPAWKISEEALKAFEEYEFKLALSKSIVPNGIDGYKYYVDYCDCAPPKNPLKEPINNKIHIVYHACEWLDNYISDDNINDLIEYLNKIENKKFIFV